MCRCCRYKCIDVVCVVVRMQVLKKIYRESRCLSSMYRCCKYKCVEVVYMHLYKCWYLKVDIERLDVCECCIYLIVGGKSSVQACLSFKTKNRKKGNLYRLTFTVLYRLTLNVCFSRANKICYVFCQQSLISFTTMFLSRKL